MTATAKSACPTDDELKDLLAESDPSARCEAMTGHLPIVGGPGRCDRLARLMDGVIQGKRPRYRPNYPRRFH